MNKSGQEIFDQIRTIKEKDSSGISSEKRFLDYCKNILGSSERLHFDYKEKEDRSHPRLGESDKRNLAKGLSGFANYGGGVLIWGIQNETVEPKPVTNPQKFLADLLKLSISSCDPVVQGVDAEWILSEDSRNQGYVILLIPESPLPPHRVILKDKDVHNQYYMRSGESFSPASHTQLEDMFGRRPKPQLKLFVELKNGGSNVNEQVIHMIIGVENFGRGIAKYPYFSIAVLPPYRISEYGIDGNMHFGLPRIVSSIRSKEIIYGASTESVILSGMVLEVTAIELKVLKNQPFSEIPDVVFDYLIAAEGIASLSNRKVVTGKEIFNFAFH